MPELCIRIHEAGNDFLAGLEYLKSVSRRWFYARHATDRPHYHVYIDTDKKEQGIRVQLKRKLHSSDNRTYTVAMLRSEMYKYYSYVMLKPESEDLQRSDGLDDVHQLAVTYAHEVATQEARGVKIKAVNWFQDVYDNCKWNCCKSDRENFTVMFKYLVKRKYVNVFTIGKMQQMFNMWKAQYMSDDDLVIESDRIFREYIRW